MTQGDGFQSIYLHGTVKEKIVALEQIDEGTKIIIFTTYRDKYGGEDNGETFAGIFKEYTGDTDDTLAIEITSPYKMPRGYDENEQPFTYWLKLRTVKDNVNVRLENMRIPYYAGDNDAGFHYIEGCAVGFQAYGDITDNKTQYITAILKLKDQNLTVEEMCMKYQIQLVEDHWEVKIRESKERQNQD